MDPCPFARLIVESLALQLPMGAKPSAGAGVHPSATPCYCKITLKGFSSQTALLPLSSSREALGASLLESATCAPGFHLDPAALRRMSGKPMSLRVSVYSGRMGKTCGMTTGKLLGRVNLCVDLKGAEAKPITFHSGWMRLGKGDTKRVEKHNPVHAKIHLVVRSEPDPRFVFQFGGEPECSPVVYQIQGNIRQPVFSCKFSADRNSRSRSLPANFAISNSNSSKKWMVRSLSGEKEKPVRERKGWMIMIYDLSGSAVAAASVITPFVPSPGSDRVSRSNPGAWLILRPQGQGSHVSSWKPWGRLEAWRERGPVDGLGYKFELVTENGPTRTGISIAEATLSIKKGGQFCIDKRETIPGEGVMRSPVRGFVMGSTVEGEGKASKPMVQVGMQHVTCMADAALFVALSAAIDLSMDACRLFSQKLRKELCYDDQHDLFS